MTLALGIQDFNIDTLGLLQRILVTTDGTLTEMLAAMFLEPIELVKIAVTIAPTPEPFAALALDGGSTLMRRQIILRGSISGTPYAYAEVAIAPDRLDPRLRDDLLEGRVTLGHLWISHRLEIFKERLRVRQRLAGALARHLDVGETDTLIERAYRTFTGGQPVFLVTEYFPSAYRRAAP
jgi:chorismate-pyruvate lyase